MNPQKERKSIEATKEQAEQLAKAAAELDRIDAQIDARKFKLIAYAPFELNGLQYAAGEAVKIPAGWKRDPDFDEFRQMAKKLTTDGEKLDAGIAFMEVLPPLSKGGDDRVYRHILPVKEA